jgi:hypothetical protein
MPNDVSGSLGGSSFSVQGAQSNFDVSKEADVIALLKLIHQNPLDGEIKNHLRDLIFLYRQDLTEESHKALQGACSELGIVLSPYVQKVPKSAHIESAKKETHPQTQSWNTARPVPSFSAPKIQVTTPASVTVAAGVATPESVVQKAALEPVTPNASAVVPQNVPIQKNESNAVGTQSPQERIAYIKKEINEKVGNPVHLIEADNLLGREYMNALLDAMKKVNASAPGELEAAMVKLEHTYAQVLQKLGGESVVPTPPAEPTETSTTSSTEPPIAAVAEAPVIQAPTFAPAPEARVSELEAKLAALKSKFKDIEASTPKITPSVAPVSAATPKNTVPIRVDTPVAPTAAIGNETPQPGQKPAKIESVAKNKQLEDLMRTKRVEEVQKKEAEQKAAESKMDPLFIPEVTAGLLQLLSEWKLFRSSGFFGTGPSGKDHELYQKISGLTMASVVAGRFEGATPLIKQSIGDYMNGWRYEEGIIHEHGETFEHYLRKVVHHILSKKKAALGIK